MSDKKPETQPKGPREKPMTKVVVRRLPPNMDEKTFLDQIAPVPNYDYFYMVNGDPSNGENSFSRAYINFVSHEDVYDFKERFDNYVFVDASGHEYPAVVEFAPFQKIPKKRNKNRTDPKAGTIETDPLYLEFMENLNKPLVQEEKPEYSLQLNAETKNVDITTPLLEYIKHRRAEKMRMREERREERKRKELDKKKYKEDERRRKNDDRSPTKNYKNQYSNRNIHKDKSQDTENSKNEDTKPKSDTSKDTSKETVSKEDTREKFDKNPSSSSYYKGTSRKYDDRKKEPKKYPPRRDNVEKREFKNQKRDDYKDREYKKYDESKKDDTRTFQNKKVKKYSEKREERKLEAQKAEQKKQQVQETNEQSPNKPNDADNKTPSKEPNKEIVKGQMTNRTKDVGAGDATKTTERHPDRDSRRIRNKDRPALAIYRPGMLSKKKHSDGDAERKEDKE